MPVGLEERLPAGFLLSTVEKVAGYARSRSMWPAFFGLACCAYEVIQTGGPRHDLARFGMEVRPVEHWTPLSCLRCDWRLSRGLRE